MVQETMVLVAKKHKEWIKIVISFGCDKEIAEEPSGDDSSEL